MATSTDFDWKTLLTLLKSQPVARDDLAAHRELIEVEHQLYGIDEPTMARQIQGALDLATNHFDAQKFKRQVAAKYKRVAAPTVTPRKQIPTDDKQLTNKDRQLLKSTDNYAPVAFLQALKEQTGGYVTAGERNVLTRLIQDGSLPSSVINVLSWYVIADLGNATLKGNFVDAIANDWLRAGVHDGASALIQLKKFNQDRQQSPVKRSAGKRSYRRMEVRETMPDWSKQDEATRTKKASASALAKARARQANNRKGR
ncbi:MAG: DnaD domain protein [Limosilactobacillus pontis]